MYECRDALMYAVHTMCVACLTLDSLSLSIYIYMYIYIYYMSNYAYNHVYTPLSLCRTKEGILVPPFLPVGDSQEYTGGRARMARPLSKARRIW